MGEEEEEEEEEEIVGSGVVFDVWIFMLVLLYVYGSGRKYERRFLSLVFFDIHSVVVLHQSLFLPRYF